MAPVFYIGVDVGTSSVRAALVNETGHVVKTSVRNIAVISHIPGYYEQSSDEIWSSCCHVIKNVMVGTPSEHVRGIGFDATCSLVVLDADYKPVTVNKEESDNDRNIIMWLDHRAAEQAKSINSTRHELLKYVGGKISLEMQSPKILWLKQKHPKAWSRAAHFFDLPDFLTWRATGSLSRSMCSVVCKWTYQPSNGWSRDFWSKIGLNEFVENNFEALGNHVNEIGGSVGSGITLVASNETGLKEGTAVAVSVIDAHCGGIGVVACPLENTCIGIASQDLTGRIALISGTSSCHMAISKMPHHVPGVWGPYHGVMIPDYWINEGGQSSVANLLDHIVKSHSAYSELKKLAAEREVHTNSYLNEVLEDIKSEKKVSCVDLLTKDIHIWPDFHGNRSPLADSQMKGMINGLSLDKTIHGLALLYLAAVQGLALGTRHILDAMRKSGHFFKVILLTGGLQKNSIFVQTHANATDLPIVVMKEEESVLLGGAILAACASGNETFESATRKMCHVGKVVQPKSLASRFYEKKYSVFLKMAEHQKECRDIMNSE